MLLKPFSGLLSLLRTFLSLTPKAPQALSTTCILSFLLSPHPPAKHSDTVSVQALRVLACRLCSSYALFSKSASDRKRNAGVEKASDSPRTLQLVCIQHSCQLGRLPELTVLLKLASFCTWDCFQFLDRPISLPQELPEEMATAFWLCASGGQGGKSAFSRKGKSRVHSMCSEKNGNSGQAWPSCCMNGALAFTLQNFLQLLIGLAV